MSGTTYSRTSGAAILPGTWQAVLARHPGQALAPHERLGWDESSAEQRQAFMRLAGQELTDPPPFLRFNLAQGAHEPGRYPAAVPAAQGRPADGRLMDGQSLEMAARQLGVSAEQVQAQLGKFSGEVFVTKLLPGTRLYRTVGLMASSAVYGSVTNRLLGEYWEPRAPSTYASIHAWRQSTAVLAEWNGDYGYVEVELDRDLVVLQGMAGMQLVDVVGEQALPGGGLQFYVPDMQAQLPELAQRMRASPVKALIRPTRFGEGAQ